MCAGAQTGALTATGLPAPSTVFDQLRHDDRQLVVLELSAYELARWREGVEGKVSLVAGDAGEYRLIRRHAPQREEDAQR